MSIAVPTRAIREAVHDQRQMNNLASATLTFDRARVSRFLGPLCHKLGHLFNWARRGLNEPSEILE